MSASSYIVLRTDLRKDTICYAEGPGLSILGCQAGDLLGRRLNDIFNLLSALSVRLGVDIKVRQGEAPWLIKEKPEDFALRSPYRNGELNTVIIQFSGEVAGRERITGERIPGRRALKKQWEALTRQAPLVLVIWDIDCLQQIGRVMGPDVRKKVLKHVSKQAGRLVDGARRLFKLDNDDFLFVLTSKAADQAGVRELLARLTENAIRPLKVDDYNLNLAINAGLVRYPDDGTDLEELLKKGGQAIFKARRSGRNTWATYEQALDASLLQEIVLEADLREAILTNRLELYYQPQAQIATGKVTGVEALLRWNHPVYGYVSPVCFVPLAERAGLANMLTEWVLTNACRQGKRWLNEGVVFGRIAVNVSAGCFAEGWLNKAVENILTATGLEPHFLELEITENIEVAGVTSAREMLAALRRCGVTVAFDDFGIGYSSFKYIKQFPLDAVKIDRLFVADMGQNIASYAIVKSVLRLAADLGLRTVAEGVETIEQLRLLQEAGCNEYQGYLLSPPVPAPNAALLLCRRSE